MNDESLDSFINGNVSGSQMSSQAEQPDQAPSYPRLRKIKRPKIRPAIGIQEVPTKVQPPLANQSSNENSSDKFSATYQTDMIRNMQESHPDATDMLFSKTTEHEVMEQTDENISTVDNGYAVTSNGEEINNDISEVDPREDLRQSTNIVKAIDAQNMIRERDEYGNTFVSDDEFSDYDYEDEDIDNVDDVFIDSDNYVKKKVLFMAVGICFVVGLLIGKVFFASTETANYGLEEVVTNPDVPSGRPRCGLTDKSQACVFYLMNWYRQELNGRDFYKLAAQLTGREEYMIETDNLRYATVKIKPGNFAQLNIPALQ